MRIWTLSPKYLDTKGLVALWRETLLAKHVLEGKTKGYTMHPQLDRFKSSQDPLVAINKYLELIYLESLERNYKFDPSKFARYELNFAIPTTSGQVAYELEHLRRKVSVRDPERLILLPAETEAIEVNPIFSIVPGEIEPWEIITT